MRRELVVDSIGCGVAASGFQVSVTGSSGGEVWHNIEKMTLGPAGKPPSLLLTLPPQVADAGAAPTKLRYLFADWPTPTVYNSESFLGLNGELPTAPFEMPITVA